VGEARDGLRLLLRVSPGASRDAILGIYGDRLKLSVRAAPEKGKANRSVVKLVEGALSLAKGSVEIVAGAGSSSKTVSIRGIDRDTLLTRLEELVRPTGKGMS